MAAESGARPAPPGIKAFEIFEEQALRWADNDIYGHMNNVIAYALFDSVINARLVAAGLLDPATSPVIFVVVETGCRYFSSLAFPQKVRVGLAVAHLGASSVRYRLGLFAAGAEVAAMEGHFVHVAVDRVSRRPVAIPPAQRAFLAALMRPLESEA